MRIVRHQDKAFAMRSCDEQTIKWIAVVHLQVIHSRCMAWFDWQHFNPGLAQRCQEISARNWHIIPQAFAK